MGKNWFVEDANDFGYVVSDVVKLMVSNKSAAAFLVSLLKGCK